LQVVGVVFRVSLIGKKMEPRVVLIKMVTK